MFRLITIAFLMLSSQVYSSDLNIIEKEIRSSQSIGALGEFIKEIKGTSENNKKNFDDYIFSLEEQEKNQEQDLIQKQIEELYQEQIEEEKLIQEKIKKEAKELEIKKNKFKNAIILLLMNEEKERKARHNKETNFINCPSQNNIDLFGARDRRVKSKKTTNNRNKSVVRQPYSENITPNNNPNNFRGSYLPVIKKRTIPREQMNQLLNTYPRDCVDLCFVPSSLNTSVPGPNNAGQFNSFEDSF